MESAKFSFLKKLGNFIIQFVKKPTDLPMDDREVKPVEWVYRPYFEAGTSRS